MSQDAVVVIPGIMGSELLDRTTGRVVWGLRRTGWYVDAWTGGHALRPLALTEQERAGRTGRLRATGLLRFPAFAPVLAGAEPYTALLRRIGQTVADPAALLPFPYDWRLPVAHNAALLAEAAHRHLARWRAHPAHDRARRRQADDRPARLVLVAHSTGGLLCRALGLIPGALDEVRSVVTLGTPFAGAAKAAVVLNAGQDAPAHAARGRMRDLAATLPGLHDLLPQYQCVADATGVRALTPQDVASLGGDGELAEAARVSHARAAAVRIPGHRALIGVQQPTTKGLVLRDGVVEAEHGNGDGVVPCGPVTGTVASSAAVAGHVSQQHGPLAKSADAIEFACAAVRGAAPHALQPCDPALPGTGSGPSTGLGLDVPDVVTAGSTWRAGVVGARPDHVLCQVADEDTGAVLDRLPVQRTGAAITLPAPGIYRVTVTAPTTPPVTQLVMAVPAEAP